MPAVNIISLSTPGDSRRTRSSGAIIHQTFYEGYFMEDRPLSKEFAAKSKKTNVIIKFIKKIISKSKI